MKKKKFKCPICSSTKVLKSEKGFKCLKCGFNNLPLREWAKQEFKIKLIILITITTLFISLFGGFLNNFVISKNNEMMPFDAKPFFSEDCFYAYKKINTGNIYDLECKSKKDIKFYILSDIIPFKDTLYSIGDILLIFAIFLNIPLMIILIYINVRHRKK